MGEKKEKSLQLRVQREVAADWFARWTNWLAN